MPYVAVDQHCVTHRTLVVLFWHLKVSVHLEERDEVVLSDDNFQKETSTDDCLEGCGTGNEAASRAVLAPPTHSPEGSSQAVPDHRRGAHTAVPERRRLDGRWL